MTERSHDPGEIDPQALLLKVDHVMKVTNLGKTKVWEEIYSGSLPAIRIGRSVRIRRSDLEMWIDRMAQEQRASATAA